MYIFTRARGSCSTIVLGVYCCIITYSKTLELDTAVNGLLVSGLRNEEWH